MVQILPEAPSFGTQFAKGLGGGISQGLSQSADFASKMAMKKIEMNQLKSLLGQDSSSKPNQEILKQQFLEALPQIEQHLGRELTPQDLDQLWNKAQQLGGMQQQPQGREFSTSEKLALAGRPEIGRVFAEREKTQQKEEFAREQKGEEHLLDLQNKLMGREESAMRHERLSELFSPTHEMNFPPSLLAAVFTKDGELNPVALSQLSGDAQEAVKLLADEVRGVKDTFGSQISGFEVRRWLARLPSLLNTAEGKRRVLRDLQMINKMNIDHDQGVLDIVDKYGGPRKISMSKAESIYRKENSDKIKRLKQEFIHPESARFNSFSELDASLYNGREAIDEETGEKRRSNGKEWVPL